MTDITMPHLSDSMTEGTILTWLRADGDAVAEGEELVEIETDKATMTYESPAAGVLAIVMRAGETAPVGAVIARAGAEAVPGPSDGASAEVASAPSNGHEPAAPAAAPPSAASSGAPAATPVARRLARQHGVDLAAVSGSGPRGRITRADVAAAAGIAVPSPPSLAPSPPSVAPPPAADGETRDLTRVQQVIARRMSEASATVPDFQVQTEVAMDRVLSLRAELKASGAAVVPSLNDFVVRASALALREHPVANGSFRDGRIELHAHINVGIAVAAEGTLIVPAIHDADQRSVSQIASESRRLAERVRDGSVTPAELSDGTFTVSNLGMYGMTAIVPVVNVPQSAILGVGAVRPVLARDESGEIVDRQLMTLTLSCDHRILYGADAARFLAEITELLERPLRLML
jgi:pyruvate dehydrogenase E2 component (dihydrolipoamide acetyltransferase)